MFSSGMSVGHPTQVSNKQPTDDLQEHLPRFGVARGRIAHIASDTLSARALDMHTLCRLSARRCSAAVML